MAKLSHLECLLISLMAYRGWTIEEMGDLIRLARSEYEEQRNVAAQRLPVDRPYVERMERQAKELAQYLTSAEVI